MFIQSEYLIVKKTVLPDYYEKVVVAKNMIRTGAAKDVSEAVKLVGISRSTYYKYKDDVFEASGSDTERRAVISMVLLHETGVLSKVLNTVSDHGANIITISQTPPISGRANVVVTISIEKLSCELRVLLTKLGEINGVENPNLLDME